MKIKKRTLKRKSKKIKQTKKYVYKSIKGGDNSTIQLPTDYNKEQIYNKMKKYNVIFGGTVRDSEKYIKQNLEHIEKCGKLFNSFKVVIYENDSSDKTRELLNNNKKDNYIYIFEDNVQNSRRTVRLANGRNKILDEIRKLNKDNKYEYMIILDLDDVNISGKFVDTIHTCFLYDDWDVLTGNQSDKYYDLWALRMKNYMDYNCIRAMYANMSKGLPGFNTHIVKKMKKFDTGQLLEINSGFGGIAIYKLNSIPDKCKYIGFYEEGELKNTEKNAEKCEHVPFNECIKNSNKKIYINTSFLTN